MKKNKLNRDNFVSLKYNFNLVFQSDKHKWVVTTICGRHKAHYKGSTWWPGLLIGMRDKYIS